MSANNEIYIRKNNNIWEIFDRDVDDNIEEDAVNLGWAESLEVAVKKANKYMETNEVEYGLNIELSSSTEKGDK